MPEPPGPPNLTKVTEYGRDALKYTAVALVALMVGRFLLGAVITIWKAAHPPPPPPPTVGFGQITPIDFPRQNDSEKPQSYTLEFPRRTLPDFGDRAEVFSIEQPSSSLLDDEKAKKIASKYNFVFSPEIIGSETYRWTKNDTFLYTLEMDIKTNHFALTSDYLSRPELLLNQDLPSAQQAISMVKGFLQSGELIQKDIATASGEIEYLKSLGGSLSPAVSESDADFLKVYLNRVPVSGKYPIIAEGEDTSVITAVIASGNRKATIVDLTFNANTILYESVETYPIITSAQAWEILQSGEGYIITGLTTGDVTVRSVELRYYDSLEQQDYFQPVYVFTGDNDFVGVVPAVSPQWLLNNNI